MKFSIIVPVYNIENYIIKCLESINNQSYKNFEVIIVNDGSTDNSDKLIKRFIKNKDSFKYYKKDNGGLSDARNYGLQYITGDYIMFIDSDDSINNELLEIINNNLEENAVDVLKFNLQYVYEDGTKKQMLKKSSFTNLHPNEAIEKLLQDEIFESACIYCYKKIFWDKYKFKYYKGRLHEDFGLTPLILAEAKFVSSIDYIGYNYLMRNGSIINIIDESKMNQKFNDCLSFFDENIVKIKNNQNINNATKKLLYSYYSNGIIFKAALLNNKYLEQAILELKKRKIHKLLAANSFIRIMKKLYIKFFLEKYIRRLKR